MTKIEWPFRWPGANLWWLLNLNKGLYARALVLLYGLIAGAVTLVAAALISSSDYHRSYAPRNLALGCSVAAGVAAIHVGYRRLRDMVEGNMRRGYEFWMSPVLLVRGLSNSVLGAGIAMVIMLAVASMWDSSLVHTPVYLGGWWPLLLWPLVLIFCMAFNVVWLVRMHVVRWIHKMGTTLVKGDGPQEGIPEVIRGRAFWPLHAMRAELERFLKNDGVSYGEVRVQFGGLAIPEKLLGPHSVFCGATGAGKTISMQLFLGTAVFLRRKLRHRVVTHDVKGDQCAFFRHNGVAESDLILCDPGSSRGWAWDIAADVRDPEGARQLAAMFCPTEKGGQPYFSQVAQELAAEVLQVLQKIAPRAWTLRDVVLVCRSRDLLKEILDTTESGRMAWRNHVENNAPSTAGSVLSTLASKLGSLSYTAGRWNEAKARFSLRAFLRAEPKVLVLRNRANRSEVSTPVFRALLRFMAEDVLAMPENHDFGKTWFVLDEVPSLGVFEKLDTFLSQARSKGGHVLLGFQDIDAMASVWGRERANALIGLCTNVTCLQTSSPTTAAYWTKAFGSYKFPEVSVTESYGHKNSGSSRTTANKTEAAILESEIMDLPPASARRGIVGCYMTPMVGMWRGETSPEVLRPLLPDLTKNKDDELEDAEVELLPWNDEDRARLGLQLRMQPDEDRPRGIPDKDGGLEAEE
jgi:hypothetical protein